MTGREGDGEWTWEAEGVEMGGAGGVGGGGEAEMVASCEISLVDP